MLLLLFAGGEVGPPDLSDPITTPPAGGSGTVTQFPAASGAWRMSLEIAEPPGTTWYDITRFYAGDRYQRGADDYKGRYRAALATVQLQIDNVKAAEWGVSPDIIAPWGQDTTDLFGSNVRLGAGLLMRLSMVREVASVVVEWLPIWTGRVESWGDASAARGQLRTHIVSVVDTLADMTNVPVLIDSSIPSFDEYVAELLTQVSWPFGVDIYQDVVAAGAPSDEVAAGINRLDQITEPQGLVWRTLRSGRMVIHPAPWDTQNTIRYDNPLLDVYPDGLKFSYSPDFTDIEYIADDDQQPFGIVRNIEGILNTFAVTMPDGFTTEVYLNDDPVSSGRYGVRPYTASWTLVNNHATVDDLLADRAYAESKALPLRTTVDHEGFWPAMAMVDHLDPVTIVHNNGDDDGLVVTGVGWVRNVVEERTVRADGLFNWQSTLQVDLDASETSAMLLPVEDLVLLGTDSPLLGIWSTATFSWTNPTQPSITPTEMQYRVIGRSFIWLPKSYPGVGSDGLVVGHLEAGTKYTFQVRLIRRVDGVVTNYSTWRQVEFTTAARIYPIPVPDGTDTDGSFPEDDPECDLEVELQENDGTGWVTIDSFTGAELTDNGDGTFSLTTPIPNSTFEADKMYRFRQSCDGATWTNGPEFDPPDDWEDPCGSPQAHLADAPYNDATLLVYVPQICAPDIIEEAVSGIAGVHGDALDEIVASIGEPDQRALLAVEQPAWDDGPAGIVAYGECPQIIGETGDKTISVRVNVADDTEAVVLFEVGGMRLVTVPVGGGGWRAAVVVYKTDGTTTLPTTTVLDADTPYVIQATFDKSNGNIAIAVDDSTDNSTSGTDDVPTISALPIWRVGAPPGSWITDCALWSRVLETGGPTVTINQGGSQADPTTASPIVFTVVFSEAVTGFTGADVALSGTAGATAAVVIDSGDHIHFTVEVSGMVSLGTVIASIPGGVAASIATSKLNEASTSTDNTVQYNGIYTDDFNRANNTSLGANWFEPPGDDGVRITSNMANGSIEGWAFWRFATGSNDNYIELDIVSVGTQSLFVRANGPAPVKSTLVAYEGYWESTAGGRYVARRWNGTGTPTVLTTAAGAAPTGGRMRLEVVGTAIKIYVGGVLKLSTTDATIGTGQYVGFRNDNGNVDNFEAGAI